MSKRLELDAELKAFTDNLYYQPPSNIKLKYPCIIYNKNGIRTTYADDQIYKRHQQWQLMVIGTHPDDETAEQIMEHFEYCSINQYYTVDNLRHVTLTLFY